MDIVIASNKTNEEIEWGELLSLRSNTKLWKPQDPSTISLETFFQELDIISGAETIDRVIISAHSSKAGYLSVPFGEANTDATEFRTLLDHISAGNQPLYQGSQTFDVIIWGCNFGIYAAPCHALKTVIGPSVKTLVAPKYQSVAGPLDEIAIDYLAYYFPFLHPDPILKQTDIIEKLKNKYRVYDGSIFSSEMINHICATLPPKLSHPKNSHPFTVHYKFKKNGVIETSSFDENITYTFFSDTSEHWNFRNENINLGSSISHQDALKKMIEQDNLNRHRSRSEADPLYFPYWQEMGFPVVDDYLNAHGWHYRTREDRSLLSAIGELYHYALEFPVIDTANGQLLANSWSLQGDGDLHIGLDENDHRLYRRV